jgi:hypothetical protein
MTAPAGVIALVVAGASNSARFPRSAVFSLPDGAAAAGPFALDAVSGAITVAAPAALAALAGRAPVSFRVALVNGDGLGPAGAPTVRVSIAVVSSFVVTCPLPTAARVRIVLAQANTNHSVVVREVTVVGAAGPLPPAQLLAVQPPTSAAATWSWGTRASMAPAASLAALTDGEWGSVASAALRAGVGTAGVSQPRFVDISLAGATNAAVPVRAVSLFVATMETSAFAAHAFAPQGAFIQLLRAANPDAVFAAGVGATLAAWAAGGPSTGYALNFTTDFSRAGCAPAAAALLVAVSPTFASADGDAVTLSMADAFEGAAPAACESLVPGGAWAAVAQPQRAPADGRWLFAPVALGRGAVMLRCTRDA